MGRIRASRTTQLDKRAAFIAVYTFSVSETAQLPGDIPSLLRLAYSRHFGENMPRDRDLDIKCSALGSASIESLQAMLSELPSLAPTAQVFLDRARSILTSGPPLSMNVELADGEELPVALHTLNQGAVWACLMGGGANPDLEDGLLAAARSKMPRDIWMHGKIRKTLSSEAKCLWFLCRKFFFSLNVAEKDGESYQMSWYSRNYAHRVYMGRLFMLDTDKQPALTRAWMPRALEVYSSGFTHIARTPKGLWGWGDNRSNQLGFESAAGGVDPTRLTFAACPKVAELEASLPPWEKHRMVTHLSMRSGRCFLLTTTGAIVAGTCCEWFAGPVPNKRVFNTVAAPAHFVPDHIMNEEWTVVFSMGDRQMISGYNRCGRLGLGHDNEMSGLVDLPFRVDWAMPAAYNFNIYLSKRQLLFAGEVPRHIAQSGLLPGFRKGQICWRPTPLQFLGRVTSLECAKDWIACNDPSGLL
ncbi:hypothetical protein J8273_6264 [Carpediemonas membranifera]|uniref:Uncharacterized protein n=1 Tax=Carpediemonas membranifera TaxID=201153 RepID=A0A8J6B2C7_9EUKA|nr:hypothetical protein J8273_6264 [Carpediemonas membranifera]|eukprot:KAG9391502.1 hypothetical protein J8273_6264 [Carpediemonas membranifera]